MPSRPPHQQRHRFTELRGFAPVSVPRSAQEIRRDWIQRLERGGQALPYWMHVHIPYCPQSCAYCHCSRHLATDMQQVERYLNWLEGEMRFFADVAGQRPARVQYIGGGTPNMLSDAQLERLFGLLDELFLYDKGCRRTFELLVSALRPETIKRAGAHGFNRLSFGIQTMSDTVREQVGRAPDGLDRAQAIVDEAAAVGFDEVNMDLIWGLEGESDEVFLDGLLKILALSPTTVTIHLLLPIRSKALYADVQKLLAMDAAFRQLNTSIGERVAATAPEYRWVLRPNCWILVKQQFQASEKFNIGYYSDNERLPLDIFGLGRGAQSRILGQAFYESLSMNEHFDPDEPAYAFFRSDPLVDGVVDFITDLMADRRARLDTLSERYGQDLAPYLTAVLAEMERDGAIIRDEQGWRPTGDDHVFLDPFESLMQLALTRASALNPAADSSKVQRWPFATIHPHPSVTDSGLDIRLARGRIRIVVETIDESKDGYYARIGSLGVFYTNLSADVPEPVALEEVMNRAVRLVEDLYRRQPGLTAQVAVRELTKEMRPPK